MGIIFLFTIGAAAGAGGMYWINGLKQTKGLWGDTVFKVQAAMDKRRKQRDA